MNKKLILNLILSLFCLSQSEIVTLKQGVDGYSGCFDGTIQSPENTYMPYSKNVNDTALSSGDFWC